MSESISGESFYRNPIFAVTKMVGLFPFKNDHCLNKPLLLYSFIITSVVTTFGYFSQYENLSALLGPSYNQAIVFAYLTGHMLVFPFSLLCVFIRRQELYETFRAMEGIHSIMERINLNQTRLGTQLHTLLDIAAPALCFILYCLSNGYVLGSAFGTFYGFAILGMSLISGQYSFLVDNVGNVFEEASNFLYEMKRTPILKRHYHCINELVHAANKLSSTAGKVNALYDDQILLFISICFSGFSIHLYYISTFAKNSYALLLPQVYSVIFYFYVVWRMNQSSASTTDKSKEFNTLLYQLMIEDKTNEILSNDKLRLHISMKREVVFTACGFFNLDYTLVHSMIASATTYLVILIQFGQPVLVQEMLKSTAMSNLNTTAIHQTSSTIV